jgi:hypothetical protein
VVLAAGFSVAAIAGGDGAAGGDAGTWVAACDAATGAATPCRLVDVETLAEHADAIIIAVVTANPAVKARLLVIPVSSPICGLCQELLNPVSGSNWLS